MVFLLRRSGLPLAAALVLLGSAACSDAESPTARMHTPSVDSSDTRAHGLAGLVSRTDTLSTLARALQQTGLLQELRQEGPLTLFAPPNGAFRRHALGFDSLLAPAGTAAVAPRPSSPIEATAPDRDSLRSVLQFHLVRGRFTAARLADSLRLATLLPGQSFVLERGRADRDRLRVRVRGMQRPVPVRRTLEAQNGVLHLIARPLRIPPPDTSAGGVLQPRDTSAAPQ